MLHHPLDSDYYDGIRVSENLPVPEHETFEFFHVNTAKANLPSASDLLTEIGQKIFKHNYMNNVYKINMFEKKAFGNLYTELQSLIRCDARHPAGTFLSNLTTHSETLIDTYKLFYGEWPKVKSMLDFIGKFQNYKPFGHEDEDDDVYENMYR